MLDSFLEVTYAKHKADEEQQKIAKALSHLTTEQLEAVAQGRAKVAFCNPSEGWLQKYEGTPLLDKALELERAALQNELARLEQNQVNNSTYETENQLNIQRRMLDLELAEVMGGKAPDGPEVPVEVQGEAPPPAPPPAAEPPKQEAAPPPVEQQQREPPKEEKEAMLRLRKVASALGMAMQAEKALAPAGARLAGAARQVGAAAARHPTAAATLAGAGIGAAAAGPDNRLGGALAGGAIGGGAVGAARLGRAGVQSLVRGAPAAPVKNIMARGSMAAPVHPASLR